MSVDVEMARERLKRADRLVAIGKGMFVAYFFIVSIVLMMQLYSVQQNQQTALDKSIQDNSKQHERTQEYVKCIANALLVPLAQRSSAVFDKCGIEAQADTSSSQGSSTSTSSAPQSTQPAQPSSTTPANPQTTTSSPPDPEPEGTRQESGAIRDIVRSALTLPEVILKSINTIGGDL